MFSGISGPKFEEILLNATVWTKLCDILHTLYFSICTVLYSLNHHGVNLHKSGANEESKEKMLLKYVNKISVKPQNVWMVTNRVISPKNVSLIQIQIQSSSQTSTLKLL